MTEEYKCQHAREEIILGDVIITPCAANKCPYEERMHMKKIRTEGERGTSCFNNGWISSDLEAN